ncbi:MAG: AEC family transporter [Hyphomicrobium aestuarii]|nr:AEC family transporter [Hyphomicrobium aestuarii]
MTGMFAVLSVVASVFGIIAIGYAAGRSGYISADAGQGIADFAFKIAIPALLFHTIVTVRFEGVAPLGAIASFFGAAATVWLTSVVVTHVVLGRPMVDQPSIGITSAFGNTIMLGLPIGVGTFGQPALAPISAIIACHSPLLLLAAALHAAAVSDEATGEAAGGGQTEKNDGGAVSRALFASVSVLRQLSTQPLILAIAAALIWRATGLTLPKTLLSMAETLARAGVPAALVSLGLSLTAFKVAGDTRTVGAMLVLKMLLMPLVAAGLAYLLQLPPLSAAVVIMMASLPAGANAFLFASQSGHAVNAVSGAVAIGTALSVVTITAVLVAVQAAYRL